jgi:glycosyltransferase involved in cell wall biosynthesis
LNHEKRVIKVAVLDHSPEIGGAEASILTLSRNIDKSRFNITVILPSRGNFSRELEKTGIPFHIIYLPLELIRLKRGKALRSFLFIMAYSLYIHFFFIKLCIYLKKQKFDLILTNTVKAHLYGSVAAYLCGIPVIWRFHDLLSPGDFSPTLIKVITLFGKLFPKKILAVSKTTEDYLVKNGIKKNKIEVVFSGIDQELCDSKDFIDIRHELRIGDGVKLVGCIGRLIPQKGQKIFILAIPEVIRRYPETLFLIVGDAFLMEEGYKKELFEIIMENRIGSHIKFTGFRTDIKDLIKSLDIVVFPSIALESFGLSLLEAMSLGRPVIASKVGGVCEIVEDGINGILIEPDRPEQISDRVIYLLSHQDVSEEIGENARRTVIAKFSLKTYVTAMEKVLREVSH